MTEIIDHTTLSPFHVIHMYYDMCNLFVFRRRWLIRTSCCKKKVRKKKKFQNRTDDFTHPKRKANK